MIEQCKFKAGMEALGASSAENKSHERKSILLQNQTTPAFMLHPTLAPHLLGIRLLPNVICEHASRVDHHLGVHIKLLATDAVAAGGTDDLALLVLQVF